MIRSGASRAAHRGLPPRDHTFLPTWRDQYQQDVKPVLEKIKELQVTDVPEFQGAFKRESSANADDSGLFWTLEAIFPFLLVPQRYEYLSVIQDALEFVLSKENKTTGGFPPYPEFKLEGHSAVDSTAYAVLVLAQAIDWLSVEWVLDPDSVPEGLVDRVRESLDRSVAYLDKQKITGGAGGWGFNQESPSRVYSTSLVVTALSHCDGTSTRPRELVAHGVEYLLQCQLKEEDDETKKGGWGYNEHKVVAEVSPNISGVAVQALVASLRQRDRKETREAIDQGVKYIVEDWANGERGAAVDLRRDPVIEDVAYLHPADKKSAVEKFEHPFVMVLGAALLSGEVGARNDGVIGMVDDLLSRFRRGSVQESRPDLKVYELADIASNVISYYTVTNVVPSCHTFFSKSLEASEACRQLEQLRLRATAAEAELERLRVEESHASGQLIRLKRHARALVWTLGILPILAMTWLFVAAQGWDPWKRVTSFAGTLMVEIVAYFVISRFWDRPKNGDGNGNADGNGNGK